MLALVMIVGIVGGLFLIKYQNDKVIEQKEAIQKQKEKDKQIECLATNIYWEARGENIDGQVAVAQVTLNRSNHPDFPDTICEVVYQKNIINSKLVCQFSWYCEKTYKEQPIRQVSYSAAKAVAVAVFDGYKIDKLKNALYFHAVYINPQWKRKKIATIGRHIFYAGRNQT